MKRKFGKPIQYTMALVLVGIAFYGIYTASSQQKKLKQQELYLAELYEKLQLQETLLQTDTLLVDGHYQDALEIYETRQDQVVSDDALGIGLRVAIAQKLLELEDGLSHANEPLSTVMEEDSLNFEELITVQEINKLDSLNFALEKAKVQLRTLKKQLHEKSFGEYLTLTSRKGTKMYYVGKVKNGKANGYGVAILETGSRYEGQWRDNQRHGEGTFFWADGEYYMGQYENDQRSGKGTYYWPNGEKFVGLWKNDERTGQGAFFGQKGDVVAKGVWEDDELVRADKL